MMADLNDNWLPLTQLAEQQAFAGETCLITGATGFLGSHFLYWWAKLGGRSISLVRGGRVVDAQQRLYNAQGTAASGYPYQGQDILKNNITMLADVCLSGCGLDLQQKTNLKDKKIRTVWHFAASLRFEKTAIDQVMESNVKAVENVMRLASESGAKQFIYISTAYTCGVQAGRVQEKLHPLTNQFHNIYEKSKCMAEHVVMDKAQKLGLKAIILRPAIVVGVRSDWYPAGGKSGVYGLLGGLMSLAPLTKLKSNTKIVLKGNPNARLSLISVDDVIKDCLNLCMNDFSGKPIRHVTGIGPRMQDCSNQVTSALGWPTIEFDRNATVLSSTQRYLERALKFYLPYLGLDARFERTFPAVDQVTEVDYQNIIKEYLKINSSLNRKNLLKTAI